MVGDVMFTSFLLACCRCCGAAVCPFGEDCSPLSRLAPSTALPTLSAVCAPWATAWV